MYAITLEFKLLEDVTPEHFARVVALACSYGAMRKGESIIVREGQGYQEFTIDSMLTSRERLIEMFKEKKG